MSFPELTAYQQKMELNRGNYKELCLLAKELIPYFDAEEKILEIAKQRFEPEVVRLAKSILKEIKDLGSANKARLPHYLIQLKVRMASLRYRMAVLAPLKEAEEAVKEKLVSVLIEWKKGMDLFLEKEPTENDVAKIRQLGCYPKFAKHLVEDKEMLSHCFKLIFRDNFPIPQLVEYLKTCAIDLRKVFIAPRVGYFFKYNVEVLKITEESVDGQTFKDLRLLVNGCFVSILDDKKLIECGNGLLAWKEIKQKWAESSLKPAQFEFFQDKGMLMSSPQGMVYPEGKVNVKQARWWESPQLPVFLTLTKEQLETKFSSRGLALEILSDKPCFATIEASCMDPESVDDAHGSCTLYMPSADGKTFRVFPLGKYAAAFPESMGEMVGFLCNSVEAALTYPDPNCFYTHRFHGEALVALTAKEAETVLEKYGHDVWYFQVTGDNCASCPQQIFESVIGKKEEGGRADNYFKQPIADAKHTAPGTGFLTLLGQLPDVLARPIFHGLHVLLGSKREIQRKDEHGNVIETRSLYAHDFCKTQQIYVPGKLIKNILSGEIKGITWYGYD